MLKNETVLTELFLLMLVHLFSSFIFCMKKHTTITKTESAMIWAKKKKTHKTKMHEKETGSHLHGVLRISVLENHGLLHFLKTKRHKNNEHKTSKYSWTLSTHWTSAFNNNENSNAPHLTCKALHSFGFTCYAQGRVECKTCVWRFCCQTTGHNQRKGYKPSPP